MSFIIFLFIISLTVTSLAVAGINLFYSKSIFHTLLILFGSTIFATVLYFKIKRFKGVQILFGVLGAFLGSITAMTFILPFLILYIELKCLILLTVSYIIAISFTYAGLIFGIKKGEAIKVSEILALIKKDIIWEEPKIVDTNVLIDGRIAELIDLGFIKGTIILPRFLLREIQYIADSPDPLRRAKGRRALDVLQKIQRSEKVKFEIIEKDIPEIKEVDIKLVELCRSLKGSLITNDINLAKIAQLRGVDVLNINELAMAMRTPVMPGDVLTLFVVKEGKEPEQGVAYLDDGTMVVIEDGKRFIGQTIDVTIHSVLQTSSGRMIFGKPKQEESNEKE